MTNKRKKTKKTRKIMILLGCCCILAATALSVYNYFDDKRAAQAADELTDSLVSILEQAIPAQALLPDDTELEQLEQPVDDEAPKSVVVDDYEVCGVLKIPSINIRLAIIQDWNYPNLNISACRYSGTPDGQMIIMAHNYKTHFGKLNELYPGDSVTFTDVNGNLYEYNVVGTEIWATNQLREIISGKDWDLTLFTCTYGGANRVVVRCVKV